MSSTRAYGEEHISPQQREYLRQPSGELSLGHDPDLIARYLAGEEVTEQLREIEGAEPDDHGRTGANADSPSPRRIVPIDARHMDRVQQARSAPAEKKRKERPTLAFIALAIALGLFAVSVWIAFR